MPRPIHFEIRAENVESAIASYRELPGWELGTIPMDANAK